MSAYTVAITTYVTVTKFPVVNGFTVAMQTQMIALMEASAALVLPADSAEQRIVAIEELVEANTYFNQVDKSTEYYEQIMEACEFALNLAIGANSPAGSGAKVLFSTITQGGVAVPAFDQAPYPNTMGEVPVFGRTAAGMYTVNFATTTPFTTASKVEVQVWNQSAAQKATVIVSAPNELIINTFEESANTVTGVITGADTDGILNNAPFKIVVYP